MRRLLPRVVAVVAVLAVVPVRAEDLRERDLDVLVRRSTVVARGEIVGVSPEGVADLHVQAAYLELGEKAALLRVRPEGERAMKPGPGDRGLYFLGPSQLKPGALTFVQHDFERWQFDPDADAAVDAFMARLVAACTSDAPARVDEIWIDGLALPVTALALHSAHRVAAIGQVGGIGEKGWERIFGILQDPARDETSAAVVGALAKVLPADRAVALLPKLADGSKVKAALLAATGARASASSTADGKAQARAALGAAGKDDASPEVALGAAIGLAALGDESAIPALERALAPYAEADSRHQAVEAMAVLAGKGSRAARARLHKLFEDPDGLVRAKARNAWVDAYLADPVRQERTLASYKLIGAALVMILVVVGHSLLARRHT